MRRQQLSQILGILLVFGLSPLCENHVEIPSVTPTKQSQAGVSKLTSEFVNTINKTEVINVWPRRAVPVAMKVLYPLTIRGSEKANYTKSPCLINEVGNAPIIEITTSPESKVAVECVGLRHTWLSDSNTNSENDPFNQTWPLASNVSQDTPTLPSKNTSLPTSSAPVEDTATGAGTCCIGVDGGDVSIADCAVASSAGGTCVGGTGKDSRMRLARCVLTDGAVGVAAFSGCRVLCETSRFLELREAGVRPRSCVFHMITRGRMLTDMPCISACTACLLRSRYKPPASSSAQICSISMIIRPSACA
jgi:hypothetical protein